MKINKADTWLSRFIRLRDATESNVWWLGEVPPCRMLKFSTKACGGILPNHCYKPFLLVWCNNLI